jgi:hypothetical protein
VKARVTTVLSLSGILVAGSAAALVNSQVLQHSAPSRPGAADILVTLPPSTALVSGDAASPSDVVPSASLVPVEPTTVPGPSPSQAEYQVGMSGSVIVDTGGDILRLVAPTPAPGWAVVKLDQNDPLNVSVVFQSAGQLVTFRAAMLFGVVSTSTQVESLAAPLGSAPVGVAPNGSVPTSVASSPSPVPSNTQPAPPVTVRPVSPVTTVDDRGGGSGGGSGGPVTTVDDHAGGSAGGSGGGKGRGRGGDD